METLNVRANAHATNSLMELPGNPTTIVTLIRSNKIALWIDQTYITSKYTTIHLSKAVIKSAILI